MLYYGDASDNAAGAVLVAPFGPTTKSKFWENFKSIFGRNFVENQEFATNFFHFCGKNKIFSNSRCFVAFLTLWPGAQQTSPRTLEYFVTKNENLKKFLRTNMMLARFFCILASKFWKSGISWCTRKFSLWNMFSSTQSWKDFRHSRPWRPGPFAPVFCFNQIDENQIDKIILTMRTKLVRFW